MNDPYLWLEDVEGAKALEFARAENAVSTQRFKQDPRYAGLVSEIRKILLAKDRLPNVSYRAGWLYNFWQDEKSVRGLWRRTRLSSYEKPDPEWQTLLDLDDLATKENENWVFHGANCLPNGESRCLVTLSRGGKDASVIREFDLEKREFVIDGFVLPEAKNQVTWIDRDTVFLGTDFGPETITTSGYPSTVRIWKRGQKPADTMEIFRGHSTDVSSRGNAGIRPEGTSLYIIRAISFYEWEIWFVGPDRKTLTKSPMPVDQAFYGVFKGKIFYHLKSDLRVGTHLFKAGSLVSFPLESLSLGETALEQVTAVFEPTKTRFFDGAWFCKDMIVLETLEDVKSRITRHSLRDGKWLESTVPMEKGGQADVTAADPFKNEFFYIYQDFLTPQTLSFVGEDGKVKKLKSTPARFDASKMKSEQRFATSADGTRVPYFIIHRRDFALDGSNPTIINAYGGFESSLTPTYSGAMGKAWLESGGVTVLANLRGGGEYGPTWHTSVLKENRQRVYEDLYAVAEDLVKAKITSPRHLGVMGRSNGGLLTSVAFTQRPDLFNGVISGVPLADMLRYHKLLAGASWIGEYGDPEGPKMREVILKYSPYQNLKKDAKYPEVFFHTSTKDDRVHPGHARKMAARMKEYGHPMLYFENIEGGHGAAANLEQQAELLAMQYTYFNQKLRVPEKGK